MQPFETENDLVARTGVESDELTEAVAREIEQAVCGQIGGFAVARLDGAIVLHGHCRTYHSRQLAHDAALDLIEGSAALINLIIVH